MEKTQQQRKDLYFLDEAIKDMKLSGAWEGGHKYIDFFKDWYQELYEKVGHSFKERDKYLREKFGNEWVDEGYFLSEKEVKDIIS